MTDDRRANRRRVAGSREAWRRKFGAIQTSEVKRLRDLEKENARLKRLLAERDLDIDILKELAA